MNNTIFAIIIVTLFVIGYAPEYNFGMLVVWISLVLTVLLIRKVFRQNKWIF